MSLLHLVPTSQQKTQVDSCRHPSALVDSHRHLYSVIQRPQFIQHAVRVLEARFPHPGLTSAILLPLVLALLRTTAFQPVATELISLSVPSVLFISFHLLHGLASFLILQRDFPAYGRRLSWSPVSGETLQALGLPTSVRVFNVPSSRFCLRARTLLPGRSRFAATLNRPPNSI
ncbi:hypothetical protein C8R46DRAFT_1091774 [Mycena filopes]|nr:hypothetical protein C8R46DRAFT_1091774 [Mycena filopes]